ncbi:tRNA (guanosine(18)-2'-O)-methyltransferase [Candida viswanathii]|uniref:tRNA (Guanosine(18)-2'-O)-methyltransferase n=1 Tax=Candida viswanathii TaxID=5486 RepID=A0A367Y239_9ASCO|nr:tRNA (guanosine(18)-2'-O)-methyltransferase [Candida viswanathii]
MSSAVLIAKYLGVEKQTELIEKLSLEINDSEENVEVLIELLDGFNLDEHPELYLNILKYCQGRLLNEDDYETVLKFLIKIPELRNEVVEHMVDLLKTYIKTQIYYFHPDVASAPLTNEESTLVFKYLEVLFQEDFVGSSDIDRVLLLFLGVSDRDIANLTSKLLRWRMKYIVDNIPERLIWDVIFILQKTDKDFHKSHSFILWLGYANTNLAKSAVFQQVIQTNEYWLLLQQGLISDSHEYRKFSLSILECSLEYLVEWSRFMTLYEILGIDTSLNQAEAGRNDITGLISPRALIPPSWGWCLLSTGLKASLESVRRFTLKLLLSIPHENLYLIKHGLPIFERAFLPNLMSASNLNIKVLYRQYGGNLTAEEDAQDIALSILKVLAEAKDSYGPSRIVVLHGLLEGLNDRKVLKFGSQTEGEILQTYHDTLILRLLLQFQTNDATAFFNSLNKFVKFNGFKLLRDNEALIRTPSLALAFTDKEIGRLHVLEDCLLRMRLFNKIYRASSDPAFDLSKTSRWYYKLKDEIFAEYYRTLQTTFERALPKDIKPVLEVLNAIAYNYLESTENPECIYEIPIAFNEEVSDLLVKFGLSVLKALPTKDAFLRAPVILGKIYDNEIAASPDSDIYTDVYGEEEIKYRCRGRVDSNALYSILLSVCDKIEINLDVLLDRLASDPSPMARSYAEWIIALSY